MRKLRPNTQHLGKYEDCSGDLARQWGGVVRKLPGGGEMEQLLAWGQAT